MKLDAWKQAHLLALDLYECAKRMPPRHRGHLGADLCSDALAIPSRIAFGSAAVKDADACEALESAILSARMVQVELCLARDLGCVPAKEADRLFERAEEVRNLIWKQLEKRGEKLS